PLLRITDGQPRTVNLVDDTFDQMLNDKAVNKATGQHGKALEQMQYISIPIHVTGALDAPKYAIQWGQVGSDALARAVQNEAQRQLERLLERQQQETGNDDKAASENPTGKILGEALKGLFNQ